MRKIFVYSFTLVSFSLILASPVQAYSNPDGVEQIRSFDTTISFEKSGTIDVKETIDYDFGYTKHHGIIRDIPTVYPFNQKFDRLVKLTKFSARMDGSSVQVSKKSTPQGPEFRMGDPNVLIDGEHTYVLRYKVAGAINDFPDHQELYWNVNGNGWPVPIVSTTAEVTAPGQIKEVNCLEGVTYSTLACSSSGYDGTMAKFSSEDLLAFQGMTVVVSLPSGTVPAPRYLREKFSFASAFRLTTGTGAGAIAVAILSLGFVIFIWMRSGRDEEFSGSPIDAAMGTDGPSQPTGVLEKAATPVQFEPPDNLRPAEIAGLVFQEVRSRDMSATIVDLATRGYLTITESKSGTVFKHQDWVFKKTDKTIEELQSYEQAIYSAIFGTATEKKLSDLKGTFAPSLKAAMDAVNKDLLDKKYYRHTPSNVRAAYTGIGVLLLALSGLIVVLVAQRSHFGLVVAPLPVAALAFILNAHNMPARTAKGTAAYRLSVGFRRLFTDQEAQRAKFQEDHSIFEKYLPYAVMFGVADVWAKNFSALASETGFAAPLPLWYLGASTMNFDHFVDSIDHFAVVSAGSLGYTPASSGGSGFGGGGFSGGGFGGGGGGSW